jgi:hypothetical protein
MVTTYICFNIPMHHTVYQLPEVVDIWNSFTVIARQALHCSKPHRIFYMSSCKECYVSINELYNKLPIAYFVT